ncbi:MAG: acid phosphatase [Steroidobacteraceae bacterium]
MTRQTGWRPAKLATIMVLAVSMLLGSCVRRELRIVPPDAAARTTAALRARIDTIVVIYAENRSFDNLFGKFPGAEGVSAMIDANGEPTAAYVPQRDRDGSVLAELPKTWEGVTAQGVQPAVTEQQSAGLPNAPFAIETGFFRHSPVRLGSDVVTRDLYHRFFENQMQIGSGGNEGFAAWSDAGGLTMGHYGAHHSALIELAKRYTLADHFFQGAFGGSFLNHQYLICACAPEYPQANTSPAKPRITALERDAQGRALPRLALAATSPRSALQGPPKYVSSSSIAPADYFGDGRFHAINTMQPPYQPSAAPPARDDVSLAHADPLLPVTLPAQTAATVGDQLDSRGVSWAWYAGAWNSAVADGRQPADVPRKVIYTPSTPAGAPDFQPHHQPFNYYAAFDPIAHADARATHLKDYEDLVSDAERGRLPQVVFYKPQGNLNQHPGYASIADGDVHIAELVARLAKSPQWPRMLIVITYDEFGGFWDHLRPPHGDLLGPGTRIPAIIVSPVARRGHVDHTPYDTGSVLRLIGRRFDLPKLPGLAQRDAALAAHGEPPMGDLTEALRLP